MGFCIRAAIFLKLILWFLKRVVKTTHSNLNFFTVTFRAASGYCWGNLCNLSDKILSLDSPKRHKRAKDFSRPKMLE